MKIVIAPDSFKESLTAFEVADAIETGLRLQVTFTEAEIIKIPMADGGEGSLACLLNALPGTLHSVQVNHPLAGKHQASLGIFSFNHTKTAFIEVAEACGLHCVPENKRKPLESSTFGVGELILHALDLGCRDIIVGLGGSATVDAGMGALSALGIHFKDDQHCMLEPKGSNLRKIKEIDQSAMDPRLKECRFILAHDVDSPLLGTEGALKYAPQKGVKTEELGILAQGFEQFVKIVEKTIGKEIGKIPGGGAAGGLAAGLYAFLPAKLTPGADFLIDEIEFDKKLKNATLVVTGEGQMDEQTVHGKTPVKVAMFAKKQHIPVVALVGSLKKGYEDVYQYGIDAVFSIANKPLTPLESKTHARELLVETAYNIARVLGLKMKSFT